MYNIKRSSQKIKFGDKEVDKKKFYSSKEAILLDSIDLSKIVVSSRWKLNDTTYKYFCGYLNNDTTGSSSSECIIKPLCVILPQMNGYIKYFDDGGKNMSFVTDDNQVYKKYNEIWNVVKGLLKLKFAASPIRNDKYILAKLKIFQKKNLTTFNNNNNIVPTEKNHYIWISAIDIDSVLKIDKKSYPQAYLEECKYKLKKRKLVSFIDSEIIDDSDSDIDSDIDCHNNFSVPDSYVVM